MANVTVRGNLSAAAEVRYTQDGRGVISLRFAENHFRRQEDGKFEKTGEPTWWQASIFQPQGASLKAFEAHAKQFVKGKAVKIQGTLRVETYKRNDGTMAVSQKLTCGLNDVQLVTFLGSEEAAPTPPPQEEEAPPLDDSDLPF